MKQDMASSIASIACHDARAIHLLEKALALGVLPFDKHGNQVEIPIESIGPGEFAGGRKDDDGKLRFDLVPIRALEEVVAVYNYGARKYADRNWEKGMKWSRVWAAVQRHLCSFWAGENLDPESGLHHLAHAAWGCLALLEYARIHPTGDDRPIPGL
jgi:hypothetical protein